jgi:internalin A
MSDVSKDWLELEAERRIEEVRASGVEKLDLSGLDIEMVPASVAGLEQVNWFQFLPHRRVVDVTALKQLPALQKVNLWLCNELCDLSPLTTLANLQHLGLYDCQANLSPLASLATLQHLKLFRCHSLTNISLLTSFKNLKLLDLSWNYKLTDLSPLASQANLRQLVLDGCNNLSDLAPILKLPKLKALYLIDAIPLSCQPGSSILCCHAFIEQRTDGKSCQGSKRSHGHETHDSPNPFSVSHKL